MALGLWLGTKRRKGIRLPSVQREKKVNIIAALNEQTVIAPFLYEGSMNTDWFNIYLEEVLLPALKPGQVIIMDNASFHKSIETQCLIEQAG